jgi:hypothetical protein
MGRTTRVTTVLVAIAAVLAVAAGSAGAQSLTHFQTFIGARLAGAGEPVCALQASRTERRCTLAEEERGHRAEETPTVPGRIVSFRLHLRRGPVAEGTTSVEVRLRVVPGPLGGAGAVGPWESLELEGTQQQEFPVSVPFDPGDRFALDLLVDGDGTSEAAAPIALGMSAVFERDDKTGPRLRYTYAPDQNFLRTARVYVRVRSDTEAKLFPECSLLSGPAQWGLLFNDRLLHPGRWITFACKVYSRPLEVARKKVSRGGHPIVMVHLIAYDVAGNRTAEPKIYVRAL